MGVKVTGGQSLKRRIDSSRLMRETAQVMARVLKEGESEMVDFIETRGTLREWEKPWGRSARSASIPGRDDTGAMKNAVVGEVIEVNAFRVKGVLGWPEGSPEYFRLQENGFYHRLSQEDVPGMRALRDAADNTRSKLVVELIDLIRSR